EHQVEPQPVAGQLLLPRGEERHLLDARLAPGGPHVDPAPGAGPGRALAGGQRRQPERRRAIAGDPRVAQLLRRDLLLLHRGGGVDPAAGRRVVRRVAGAALAAAGHQGQEGGRDYSVQSIHAMNALRLISSALQEVGSPLRRQEQNSSSSWANSSPSQSRPTSLSRSGSLKVWRRCCITPSARALDSSRLTSTEPSGEARDTTKK